MKPESQLRSEYEKALAAVVEQYNTAIYENRYIVGGIVERLTVAAFRAAGVGAQLVGSQNRGADAQLPGGRSISVKAQFTQARTEVRMINTMGNSTTAWTEATIFVMSNVGVGYADPDLLNDAVVAKKDVVVLPWKALRNLWSTKPQYLAPITIPPKPDSIVAGKSKMPSRSLALELVTDLQLSLLIRHWTQE